jgi:hypothetical protein
MDRALATAPISKEGSRPGSFIRPQLGGADEVQGFLGASVSLAPTQSGRTYDQEKWLGVRFTDIKTYQAQNGAG